MNTWFVMTSEREQQALPAARYLIVGPKTENAAIERCYQEVRAGKLLPMTYLKRHSIPDYTCAFHVS